MDEANEAADHSSFVFVLGLRNSSSGLRNPPTTFKITANPVCSVRSSVLPMPMPILIPHSRSNRTTTCHPTSYILILSTAQAIEMSDGTRAKGPTSASAQPLYHCTQGKNIKGAMTTPPLLNDFTNGLVGSVRMAPDWRMISRLVGRVPPTASSSLIHQFPPP